MKKLFKIFITIIFIVIIFCSIIMLWFMYETKDEVGVNNMRCKSSICKSDKSDCLSNCIKDNDIYKCIYNNYYGEEINITCSSKLIENK